MMISAMALTGMWFGDPRVDFYKYSLALLVAIAYSGIAMVHNDIIDLDIDKINAPDRVLPSGKISIRQATVYAIVLFVIGTLAGSFLTVESVLIMFSTLVLSLLYNSKLKKLGIIGNFTVGLTATSAFLYGDAVSAGWEHFWPVLDWTASVYLFLISALINTSREVCKGIMDVEGDQEYGVETVAVLYGTKIASRLVLILISAAMIVAIVPLFITKVFGLVFIIAIFAFIVLVLRVGVPLIRNPNFINAKNFKNQLHPIMLLALVLIILDVILKKLLSVY